MQLILLITKHSIERFSRAGPRGRGREWATLGVHPLSWLLSNNRLEEVCGTLITGTFSSRLLLSNQDKGCTPSVAHSLPLPLGPALLNLWTLCNVWESVVSEAWRGSPFILVGHTMQPDRFLNRILIGFFFLEGKCQNLILFNQNHFKRGVWYCFKI